MRILTGDIGGTKTLLALFDGPTSQTLTETRRERYVNRGWDSLAPILGAFLETEASVDAAVFGVAGPIDNGVCAATNLPWRVESETLAKRLGTPRVALLNDFEAVALGLDELPASSLTVLQDADVDPAAPVAVIGAGTGLGEALVIPSESGRLPRVLATEGGHTDFAPRNEVEMDLLRFALGRHARVSVERVVSGLGLGLIYDHIVASGAAPAAPSVEAVGPGEDRAAAIGTSGLTGEELATRMALERFVVLYGAEAGNLALKSLPFGGVYVAGGIAPKVIELLRAGPFIEAFNLKGRMSPLLGRMRISVVMDPAVGLLGARRLAVSLLCD